MPDEAGRAFEQRISGYWSLPAQELLQRLRSTAQGLSWTEASARLEECGRNVLSRRRSLSRWRVLVHQLDYQLDFPALVRDTDAVDGGLRGRNPLYPVG